MTELGAAIATAIFLAVGEYLRVRRDASLRQRGERRTRESDDPYPIDLSDD